MSRTYSTQQMERAYDVIDDATSMLETAVAELREIGANEWAELRVQRAARYLADTRSRTRPPWWPSPTPPPPESGTRLSARRSQ